MLYYNFYFLKSSALLNILFDFYLKLIYPELFQNRNCVCVKRGLPVVLVVCVVLFSRFLYKKLQKQQKENHADLLRDSQKWFDMKIHLICIKTLSGWKGCTLYTTKRKFLVGCITACCAHQIELTLSDRVKNGAWINCFGDGCRKTDVHSTHLPKNQWDVADRACVLSSNSSNSDSCLVGTEESANTGQ